MKIRIPRLPAAALAGALLLLAVPAATLASGSGSGSGGGATTTSGAPRVTSVTVKPAKVAFGTTATGTVQLSAVPSSPVTVLISNDVQNSPNLVTMPTQVTISAPSSSATFAVQVGSGVEGKTFVINVSADESPSTDSTVARTQFYLVPAATTDIIKIPFAELSRGGDLKLQATADTSTATLTATFNGTPIPLKNNGGGRWEGQAKVPVSSGDVIVRSNLGGCAAKSPLTPSGSHFC
jgi:hypothetical protein